jgi:hypothetical protein
MPHAAGGPPQTQRSECDSGLTADAKCTKLGRLRASVDGGCSDRRGGYGRPAGLGDSVQSGLMLRGAADRPFQLDVS